MNLSDLPEDDGYRLWLRYEAVPEPLLSTLRPRATELVVPGDAPSLAALLGSPQKTPIGVPGI